MKHKVYYFICYVCKRQLGREYESVFQPGACIECYHATRSGRS